ncbi:MAG: hypothetical protein HY657_13760 [Acidobacteria bacterium]|nr:hypothetical protein [Acidobacteriota bacterium]
MRTRPILLATMVVGGLALPRTLPAQVPEAWFGTWRLDLEQSTFSPGPAPYRRGTMVVEPWRDGVTMTYDMVRVRGGITHMEWSGRFDGRDYTVQGPEDVITYAYTRVDDLTYEVVTKVDLTPVAVSRVTISPDGRTITTITTGRSAQGADVTTRTVYEKVKS